MNWWRNWKLRHQHRVNLGLHVIGIPLTVAAVVLAVVQLLDRRWDLWWPMLLLVAGYLLQWVGHWIEGNTIGELTLIRKVLGRTCTTIAPKYQKRDLDSSLPHPRSPNRPS